MVTAVAVAGVADVLADLAGDLVWDLGAMLSWDLLAD